MKKKALCITTIIASIGFAASVFVLAGKTPSTVLGVNDSRTHTVTFNHENVEVGAYQEEHWRRPFTLSKADAIEGSDGEKYGLASVDYFEEEGIGTFVFCDEGAVEFATDGAILTIASCDYESIFVTFALVDYATLDESKSVLSYTLNGVYHNAKFEAEETLDETYGGHHYSASVDTYSDFGKTLQVTEVKLVFSC